MPQKEEEMKSANLIMALVSVLITGDLAWGQTDASEVWKQNNQKLEEVIRNLRSATQTLQDKGYIKTTHVFRLTSTFKVSDPKKLWSEEVLKDVYDSFVLRCEVKRSDLSHRLGKNVSAHLDTDGIANPEMMNALCILTVLPR